MYKKKHYKYEQPHKILDLNLSMWVLREKKGGRWVGGGESSRTRTRDGLVRMRDGSAEWLGLGVNDESVFFGFTLSLALSLSVCESKKSNLKVNQICNPFYGLRGEFYSQSLKFSV